jgi:hypothetical protein
MDYNNPFHQVGRNIANTNQNPYGELPRFNPQQLQLQNSHNNQTRYQELLQRMDQQNE